MPYREALSQRQCAACNTVSQPPSKPWSQQGIQVQPSKASLERCSSLSALADAPPADKQVFPKLDVVGWYTTGSELTDQDQAVIQKVWDRHKCGVDQCGVWWQQDTGIREVACWLMIGMAETQAFSYDQPAIKEVSLFMQFIK